MKVSGGYTSGLTQTESPVGSTFQEVLSSQKSQTAPAKPLATTQSPDGGMDKMKSVMVLNRDFSVFSGGDKYVNHEDLEAVADGMVANASQEDRDAANYILNSSVTNYPYPYINLTIEDELDTAAKGGKADGLISQDDVEQYAREQSVAVLDEDFSVFKGDDNYVSLDDLQAVADGKVKNASQDDRDAAKYILGLYDGDNSTDLYALQAVACGTDANVSQQERDAAEAALAALGLYSTFRVLDGYNARNGKEDGLISQNDASKYDSDGAPHVDLPNPADEANGQGQALVDGMQAWFDYLAAM